MQVQENLSRNIWDVTARRNSPSFLVMGAVTLWGVDDWGGWVQLGLFCGVKACVEG